MKNEGLFLFPGCEITIPIDKSNWEISEFSANNFFSQDARLALEKKYMPFVEITDKFSRQSVSYQLSKKNAVARWLKYKEGFSCDLVEKLLDEMELPKKALVMDPFMGSGTTAYVCSCRGIHSIGFDVLPMSQLAVQTKCNIELYDVNELQQFYTFINDLKREKTFCKKIPEIKITESAYPEETSYDLAFYLYEIRNSKFSELTKNLAILAMTNCLERLSYTSKDGQYLRWDSRSEKVKNANAGRLSKGKSPIKVKLDKGVLPSVKELLLSEFSQCINDIVLLKPDFHKNGLVDFRLNSVLKELPKIEDNSINGVVTSPPYCNRYDYTRIYALELVFLGKSEKEITDLRQDLLSCTVENKTKKEWLHDYYYSLNRINDFEKIDCIFNNCASLQEVISALKKREENGDINNKGVVRMVESYFYELTFIYYELYRCCSAKAKVAFVNDNVRYAGEVIPVDFISTDLAEKCGFKPIKIYTLKQQKGNSSQQMKKFGRIPLRKSITIWEK
jgi:site-specific DNA-methyltransferase (cytosine-N4-specific)